MTVQDNKADSGLLCLMQQAAKACSMCRVAHAGVANILFPPGRTLEPQEGVAGAGRVQS